MYLINTDEDWVPKTFLKQNPPDIVPEEDTDDFGGTTSPELAKTREILKFHESAG